MDAHTGEYRWHFQQAHHDIWDYDSPNPIVLFDAEYDGRMRRGLVQVGKTGWAYILDRETGELLIGIEERPVPQEPRQATAATQPYPVGDAIVPQSIEIPPEGASITADGAALVNEGRIFTPFWTEPIALRPGTMGGANWPPSAYDPEANWLYVCATDRINQFSVDAELGEPAANQVYMGGRFTQADADDRGILAALDKRNGRLVWEFRTDAGVNTAVTTFEHAGEQHVVVHAGGGVFAGATRGDGIWMFSLAGTMNSLPAGGAGGGPTLIAGLDAASIGSIAAAGQNSMPGFGAIYSQADLRDVSRYILDELAAQ